MSTRSVPSGSSSRAPLRVRRSRGSSDWQTAHAQPRTGIPNEVPVPRNVSFRAPPWHRVCARLAHGVVRWGSESHVGASRRPLLIVSPSIARPRDHRTNENSAPSRERRLRAIDGPGSLSERSGDTPGIPASRRTGTGGSPGSTRVPGQPAWCGRPSPDQQRESARPHAPHLDRRPGGPAPPEPGARSRTPGRLGL